MTSCGNHSQISNQDTQEAEVEGSEPLADIERCDAMPEATPGACARLIGNPFALDLRRV